MTEQTTDCRYACAAFPHCGCSVEALSPPAPVAQPTPWDEWRAALIAASDGEVSEDQVEQFRGLYDAGFTPAEAWAEECSYG